MEPYELGYAKAMELMRSGELSSRDLCRSALDRMAEVDSRVGAFLTVREPADVLREADEVDAARSRGDELGPLAGVPVAVKDNIACTGMPTTAGSSSLSNYQSPYDATVVRRLREARAVVTGKTNMDEFAMGSSCENSAFRVTRNPWNLSRVPGGSSGGSAAAVSAGMSTLALGSDTGGSVRQPAGFCGVVGFLPSYGAVSRYGLVAFASSLDQIGPMSRDVAGASALFSSIAGMDPLDATSVAATPVRGLGGSARGASDRAIGLPVECVGDGVDAAVATRVRAAAGAVGDAGARVVELSLPSIRYAVAAYHVVADAEASTNLARYDGVGYGLRGKGARDLDTMYRRSRREGFGLEVKRRVVLGTFVLSEGYRDRYYALARRVRSAIAAELAAAFEDVDLLVMPTSPTTAFGVGERIDDPLAMYLSDAHTVAANLAGLPAVSLPCGHDDSGMPVGLQLIGRRMADGAVLDGARIFEEVAGCACELPEIG